MALVIKSKREEEKIKFFLEGELDLQTSNFFKDSIKKEYNKEASNIELDFSNIDFIDSTCLGILVTLSKEIAEDNSVTVSNLKDHVKKVFTITGLDKLFIKEGEK